MRDEVDKFLPSLGVDETPKRNIRCIWTTCCTLVPVKGIIDGEGRKLESRKERKDIIETEDWTRTETDVEWVRWLRRKREKMIGHGDMA